MGLVGDDDDIRTLHIADLTRDPAIRARFGDGIVYARLNGNYDLALTLSSWLTQVRLVSSVGVGLAVAQLAQQVRDQFADRAILIVLDQVMSLTQALSLNLGGKACACVFTTESLAVATELAGQMVVSLL